LKNKEIKNFKRYNIDWPMKKLIKAKIKATKSPFNCLKFFKEFLNFKNQNYNSIYKDIFCS